MLKNAVNFCEIDKKFVKFLPGIRDWFYYVGY